MDSVESSLAREGIEHEVFSGSEANRRYPDQLTLPSDYKCVFEKDGGILLASKAMGAMQVCEVRMYMCMPVSYHFRINIIMHVHAHPTHININQD